MNSNKLNQRQAQPTNNAFNKLPEQQRKRPAPLWVRIAVGAAIGVVIATATIIGITIYSNVSGSDAVDTNMYPAGLKKPIIYLYPTADTNVTVKLGKPEELTVSYPTYDTSTGWRVLAKPSGELVDLSSGRNLYSLYYESNLLDSTFKVNDDGFIVRREDIASFLEDKLAKLGLNEYEAEEFIVYWLPRLSEHDYNYNYIRFATIDEINGAMPLDINPAPDTIIRVLMTYKGLDEPLKNIQEQQLPDTPARTGFTAVEWGGSEI